MYNEALEKSEFQQKLEFQEQLKNNAVTDYSNINNSNSTTTMTIVLMIAKIVTIIQCNPDIRELSGPENSIISGFGLFCLGNTGSNLGQIKKSLLYPGYTVLIIMIRN